MLCRSQRVKLVVTDEKGEKELVDYKVDDLIFRPRKRREKVKMDDELKELVYFLLQN